MSKRKATFVVPLKGAKLKLLNDQEKSIQSDTSITETTTQKRNQSKPNKIYPKKTAGNIKNKQFTENKGNYYTLNLQEFGTSLPDSLPIKTENQNYSQVSCPGTELYRHEFININQMDEINTNLQQPMDFDGSQIEMSIFDNNEKMYDLGNINMDLDNYSDMNATQILDNLNKNEVETKFDDLHPSEGLVEISHSLYDSSQVISEDPYEIMINAFMNNPSSYDNDNIEENKGNGIVNGNNIDNITILEESPVILDISCNTRKYCTFGHWDFETSQESDKSEYLEEDKENLTLLKETLKGGILISDWLDQPKTLPSAGRLIQARREAEDSIIKLAKARQEQIDLEVELPHKIESLASEEEVENSATDCDAELEKDKKCEEIARYSSNTIWRRPVKDSDPELQKGPVQNPPPPALSTFVTYTPAGQKYTVNIMEGRPTKFKNVGEMMMWDISSRNNTQRMIDQIENGYFFPNSLDYERENKFRQLLKSQKKKLFKWVSAVTWNLESDINFLISEKDILLCDLAIKKWRPKNHSAYILQFLDSMDNVPIDGLILLKNPLILSTLFKLTLLEWTDISQRASVILDKFKVVMTQGLGNSFKESFRNQLHRYKKASEHLRHLYQQLLITSKFYHVPNIEENLSPLEEKTVQGAIPQSSFFWD